ncbi:MAG: NTP transferase domain-containing protein [Nanoarchaeota archaeon]|nr:NTP transferase domain-containing protein [Nanoarchaeota archaeon]
MKAIILAAGYGVRLEQDIEALKKEEPEKYERIKPFIESRSKPMIIIAGKPLVQYSVENLERTGIDQIYIVTNNKYHSQFEEWRNHYHSTIPIKLINDGTSRNEERLGAVNDLLLVLREEDIEDDVLVLAGDNLLKFELKDLIDFFREKQTSVIVVYKEKDNDKIRRSACVQLDENNLVVNFEEKPKEPRSEWICPAIYVYAADTIKLIKEMKFGDDKKDLIGNIPLMLYNKIHIHAFSREEKIRFDLGSISDFEVADNYFRGKE